MGKIIFQKSIAGSDSSNLPNDKIYAILSKQRLQYAVADHLNQPHLIIDFAADDEKSSHIKVIKEAFAKDPILRSNFKKALFLLADSDSVLTPQLFISDTPDSRNPLIKWNKGEVQLADKVLSGSVENQFKIEQELLDTLGTMFPGHVIMHNNSWLVTHLSQISSNIPGHRVFVNVTNQILEILFIKDGKLQFTNQYRFTNEEDFIYYILLVFDQFQLNPDSDIVAIFGDTDQVTSHIDLLKDYIRNIQFLQQQVSYSEQDPAISSQMINKYYCLLSLSSSKIN